MKLRYPIANVDTNQNTVQIKQNINTNRYDGIYSEMKYEQWA